MAKFDLQSPIAALREVGDDIQREWEETKPYWSDANATMIEEEHLRPLLIELQSAMSTMLRLSELAQQARRECLPDTES